MLEAERQTAFELGSQCAIAGGSIEDNPLRDGEPLVFMAWRNGFHSQQTIDPDCMICRGSGSYKPKRIWTGPKYKGKTGYEDCELWCNCNIASPP